MKKLTQEEFLQKLKDLDIKYTPLEEYKGAKVKIKWLCYKNPKHIFEASPSGLYDGNGCPFCSGQRVFIGETDLWTTHPEVAKMLKNPEDGYKYSAGSGKKVEWLCPDCGNPVEMIIHNVIYRGLRCSNCSDGISYPEKFIMSLLKQLEINFVHDRPTVWSGTKRYDFFIEQYSVIIECHGLQHYDEMFATYKGGRSLSEEKENDILKKNIAISNGIDTYIELNCSKSEKDFIKNSIINSEICLLFDLSSIDWDKCDLDSHKSYYFDILRLWNNGVRNPIDIADDLRLSRRTITKVLHILTKNSLCDYDSKKSFKENAPKKHYRKVVCLDTKKIYESIKSTKYDGFDPHGVSECCAGRNKTHKNYHWMYYDEYLKLLNKGVAI